MAKRESKHKKSPETQLRIEGISLDGLSLREFDKAVFERFGTVCGIDEAGRGPLAGPVVAAAVILDPENPIEGLDDSKKLTEKKREALYDEIREKALNYCISEITAYRIDQTDILSADLEAMRNAFEQLKPFSGIVLIDGDVLPEIKLDGIVKNVIKGDAKSGAIAAASILAKVYRDRKMRELAEEYPGYGWERNMGYPTKEHLEALKRLGVTPHHRQSYGPVKAVSKDKL